MAKEKWSMNSPRPFCPHCLKPPFKDDNLSDLRNLVESVDGEEDCDPNDLRLHYIVEWARKYILAGVIQHAKNDEEIEYLLATIGANLIDSVVMDKRTKMYAKRLEKDNDS